MKAQYWCKFIVLLFLQSDQ